MAQYVPDFNAANTEDRLQIDPSTQTFKFYAGSAWRTVGNAAAGTQSSGLAGTTSPLLVENLPLWAATANTTALATGVQTSTAIYLTKGTLVTSLAWFSGGTAESNPVHAWGALYDTAATPALIGQSTDDTSHTWATYTLKKFTLASPYIVTTTGVHYASLMLAATVAKLMTTVATADLLVNTGSRTGTGAYDRTVTHETGKTTTAASTITSTTVVTTTPWVGVF